MAEEGRKEQSWQADEDGQRDVPPGVKLVRTLRGHTSLIGRIAWSPDGRMLASPSDDLTIRLWDGETGECVRKMEGHECQVVTVAFDPAGGRLAGAGYSPRVGLWDISLGELVQVLHGSPKVNICVAFESSGRFVATSGYDHGVAIYDKESGRCIRRFWGHKGPVNCVAMDPHGKLLASGSHDGVISLWDPSNEEEGDQHFALRTLEGHGGSVWSVAFHPQDCTLVSGSADHTVRLWDAERGRLLSTIEGHTGPINCVAFSSDGCLLASKGGSGDDTIRLWSGETGESLALIPEPSSEAWFSGLAFHPQLPLLATVGSGPGAPREDRDRLIHIWELDLAVLLPQRAVRMVTYASAKVVLVGDTGAGKTGLSRRLASDVWEPSDSTVGAWATQWKMPVLSGQGVEREVWLWDFGGQADQRLIHQLYMDQTQVAALVFDPQKDDVFETLGQWDRDLSRADKDKPDRDRMTKLLVAGRCDAGSLRVPRKQVEDFAAERGYAAYLETSAKFDAGCAELKQAIIDGIKWENIPWRSSPVLFKRLKDEIIRLKDEGRVLMRFNELREMLALRMSTREPQALASGDAGENVASEEPAASAVGSQAERFTDAELEAVIGLLAGPGVVWELEFGSWVLLQPERINAYAQAVIATIREDPFDRGCILEERVLKGDLTYHSSIERLPPDEEQFVLLAMHQILVERGLCYRHMTETGQILLIFPSYYRRERRELETAPAVQVSYEFNGFLDEIYATLVVKLHHTKEFDHDQLWRYAADFKTRDGRQLGVSLTRRAEGAGELDVYFAPNVPVGERIIFSKYIHEHLLHGANDVVRLRHYVCPHCGTPVGNRQVAMRKLEAGKKDIPCVECDDADKRIPLWDELEELFADPAIKRRVQQLRDDVDIVLDSTSKERVLVGEVISTVALAGQLCEEFTVTDHGIDMEITFRNDAGEATGRKVYLQLKSGDSYLTTRKKDVAEIFKSFTKRHVEFWMDQKFPVILVIRNSTGEIRWMEIRDHLKKVTNNGKKQVRQIEFDGKRFDVMSVRRWRADALGLQHP